MRFFPHFLFFFRNGVDFLKSVRSYGWSTKAPGSNKKEEIMYIDAGTGSMALQAAAAVFFTAAVFCRQIFTWCRGHLCARRTEGQ